MFIQILATNASCFIQCLPGLRERGRDKRKKEKGKGKKTEFQGKEKYA